MHTAASQASKLATNRPISKITPIILGHSAGTWSKYNSRGTATAAAGATSRRMAEASLSCPYTDLDDGIKKLLQLPGPHYVLFMADPDPATGVSWCPDCVRCGPAVKGVMAEKKASLLEVLVGQRSVWKDPQHPLRHHPQIQLSGVPDVMLWGADGPTAKMGKDLEKAASPAEAVAVVAAFINKTA